MPFASTTAVVAVDPVVVDAPKAPLLTPSKYRKTPFRAQGVRTVAYVLARPRLKFMSHKAKKNVLFLMIGPPALMVPWLILLQFGTSRLG